MTDDLGDDPKFQGLASRAKRPSPLGTTLFVGLRAADIALQYSIFHFAWGPNLIRSLGGNVIAPAGRTYFGLTPYAAIMTSMAIGGAAKQYLNTIFISEQEMKPLSAVIICAFTMIFDSANSLLSLWVLSSVAPAIASPSASILDVCRASPTLSFGVTLYTVGILIELTSEIQRRAFKRDPANKGKPYGGGLFSVATNINYGGFTLWRAGYAIAAAGLPWGLVTGCWFCYDFITRAIPSLDDYCAHRYGEAWVDIKKRVPYRLLPGIY